jgi:hypothetical protein
MVLHIPKVIGVFHRFINIRKVVILALGHKEYLLAISNYLQGIALIQ